MILSTQPLRLPARGKSCSLYCLDYQIKKNYRRPDQSDPDKYANNTNRLICKYQPDFHPQEVIGEEYELLSEKLEDGQHELVLQRLVACPTNTLLRRLLDKTDIILSKGHNGNERYLYQISVRRNGLTTSNRKNNPLRKPQIINLK